MVLGDDLIEETDFAMTNSAVEVPTRPGLGVTLDMAAIEKYRMEKSS
mgnify:CR=1 FL=1